MRSLSRPEFHKKDTTITFMVAIVVYLLLIGTGLIHSAIIRLKIVTLLAIAAQKIKFSVRVFLSKLGTADLVTITEKLHFYAVNVSQIFQQKQTH